MKNNQIQNLGMLELTQLDTLTINGGTAELPLPTFSDIISELTAGFKSGPLL